MLSRTTQQSKLLNHQQPSGGLTSTCWSTEGILFRFSLPPIGNQWKRYPIRHLGTLPLGVTGSPRAQHWKVIKTLNNQSKHQKADLLTNIISSSGRDAATNKETASLLAKHYENKSKLTFNANDRKLLRTYRKTIQDSKRYITIKISSPYHS
ncbi:hypothetical protein TNCV_4363311 [Trichonephila clavipes]|nr:hypothetical protein TNCV_4363311 [Trichonephila clavipes]